MARGRAGGRGRWSSTWQARTAARAWTAQNSGITNNLIAVYCSGPCKQAWAVGSGGVILNTTDGGNHWTARQIEGGPNLSAVQFRKGDTAGWIAGDSGNIWSSRDGGRSWQRKRTSVSGDLYALCFDPQGQRGWAVGNAGAILRTVNGVKAGVCRTVDQQTLSRQSRARPTVRVVGSPRPISFLQPMEGSTGTQ